MKGKDKEGCEGFGAEKTNLRNPRTGLVEKQRRKEDRRLARARADLTRGSALARLLVRGTIDRRMFEAGAALKQLWTVARPGTSAIDFTRPKVDGGGPMRTNIPLEMLHAERRLKQIIRESGMGDAAAEVLQMVCRDDMMLTPIAMELEEDEAARRNGACSKETLAMVRRDLRRALEAADRCINGRVAPRRRAAQMRAWLADDARPTFEATEEGERHDF